MEALDYRLEHVSRATSKNGPSPVTPAFAKSMRAFAIEELFRAPVVSLGPIIAKPFLMATHRLDRQWRNARACRASKLPYDYACVGGERFIPKAS